MFLNSGWSLEAFNVKFLLIQVSHCRPQMLRLLCGTRHPCICMRPADCWFIPIP